MVNNLTILCYHLHNIPDLVYKLQSSILDKIKYCIITALGPSEIFCSTTQQKTLHRTDQGSKASRSNWLFTSVPMINIIEKICEGCTSFSSDGEIKGIKHIIGLFDDTRQYANDWNDKEINNILHNL